MHTQQTFSCERVSVCVNVQRTYTYLRKSKQNQGSVFQYASSPSSSSRISDKCISLSKFPALILIRHHGAFSKCYSLFCYALFVCQGKVLHLLSLSLSLPLYMSLDSERQTSNREIAVITCLNVRGCRCVIIKYELLFIELNK